MKRRLTLLRHAKSSWDEPALDDFDRPLNGRGRKAARRLGGELKRRRMHFDMVLASTAARVRETIEGLQEEYDFKAPIRLDPKIYMASSDDLLKLVRALPDEFRDVLLVGHNPGLERLIANLTRDDESGLRDRVVGKFPTAALAAIELPIEHWAETEPGGGELVELVLPRDLAD